MFWPVKLILILNALKNSIFLHHYHFFKLQLEKKNNLCNDRLHLLP